MPRKHGNYAHLAETLSPGFVTFNKGILCFGKCQDQAGLESELELPGCLRC